MQDYIPGLHILCTFRAPTPALNDAAKCKIIFDSIISALQLTPVGEVYHSFPGGGFTAVVCLTESHVSIHTWPEFGIATFDVFLSNFNLDNSAKAREFVQRTIHDMQAAVVSQQEINR